MINTCLLSSGLLTSWLIVLTLRLPNEKYHWFQIPSHYLQMPATLSQF